MKIEEIYNHLLVRLNATDEVYVEGNKTLELIDTGFKVLFDLNELVKEIFALKNIQSPSDEDTLERNNFLKEIHEKKELFRKDINSRRFVIQAKYIDDPDKSACLSNLQFLIRRPYKENILYCFAIFRSQNIENFLYDYKSLLLYCNELASKFDCEQICINYRSVSLHKYIK